MVVFNSQVRALDEDILTLTFPNETDVANFKQPLGAGQGVSEILRKAIVDVLGLRVKFIARVEPTLAATAAPSDDAPEPIEPDLEPDVAEGGWAVAAIPGAEPVASAPVAPEPVASASVAPEPAASQPSRSAPARSSKPAASAQEPKSREPQRYGESVVREILGASFIEEQTVVPRVTPRDDG
jgi:DNA polymerase-3 subunit gamma/tau